MFLIIDIMWLKLGLCMAANDYDDDENSKTAIVCEVNKSGEYKRKGEF